MIRQRRLTSDDSDRRAGVRRLILFACCLVPSVPTAHAQPRIDAITPVAIQKGQEVTLTFTGAQLSGAHTLLSYRDGLNVTELKNEESNRVTAQCRVAEDCRLGSLALRLCCDSGVSTLRTVSVTAAPVISEHEPNEAPESQTLPGPCTVVGVLTNEDVDRYVLEVTAGERVSLEIEGLRLGYEFYDPCLALIGPDGQMIAESDDSTLTRQDPWLVHQATAGGRYVVQVRERAYGGNDRCRYALHVGHFPRPAFAMPGGGQPGERLRVTHSDGEATIELPDQIDSAWSWFPDDAMGQAPSPLLLHVSSSPNFLEQEPNFPRGKANAVDVPVVACGVIGSPEDIDQFQFHATRGEVLVIRTVARSIMRSPLDAVIRLFQADGRYLTANDDSGGPDSLLEYPVPQDGDYIVDLRDHLGRGGPEFVYRLEITRRQPSLTLRLPERVRNVPTTICVPRSNRMAVLMTAQRQHVDGAVETFWDGLPEGVSVESPVIPPGRDRVPVLFRATPESRPQGRLVPLRGRLSNADVAGSFQQRTMLVIGQNNRDMWGHDADRVAVAVNPPAPFHLELPDLPDPLVRSGEKSLPVQIVRNEGCTAPIRVQMLYNPPGVSSPGSVVVPAEQAQGSFPLTANPNAAVGDWPIVLLGQSDIDGTRVEVSTEIVRLHIEESSFGIAFRKTSLSQGSAGELTIEVESRQALDRPAQAQLVGLPPGVSAEPQTWEPQQTELKFSLTAAPNARPGTYRSVMCRFQLDGEQAPIIQTLGTGQLRVDKREQSDR